MTSLLETRSGQNWNGTEISSSSQSKAGEGDGDCEEHDSEDDDDCEEQDEDDDDDGEEVHDEEVEARDPSSLLTSLLLCFSRKEIC